MNNNDMFLFLQNTSLKESNIIFTGLFGLHWKGYGKTRF